MPLALRYGGPWIVVLQERRLKQSLDGSKREGKLGDGIKREKTHAYTCEYNRHMRCACKVFAHLV